MQDVNERPYHHGDLRRTVIDTAMGMLAEGSDWQFTLREVARRAGVSHAAPYKHFPEKSALLQELAMIGFERLKDAFEHAMQASVASPRDQFVNMSHAYVQFGTDHPQLYKLMFSIEGKTSNLALNNCALGAFRLLIEVLMRGQSVGVFRKQTIHGQAAATWGMCHGLTMLAIEQMLEPEKVGHNAVESALASLLEGIATA